MTIYYNPAYTATPYIRKENSIDIDNIYCGDIQLLQRLLFYAGVAYLPVSNEERIAHYHTCIQNNIVDNTSSPFHKSFETDSAGMSRTLLSWRDALVEVGWNIKAYTGNSIKLSFLNNIEPEAMPKGEADYWYDLIQIASANRILPENFKVVVTCSEQEIKPHIAHIFAKQQAFGVSIEYRKENNPCAKGNLGNIQKAILAQSNDKIVLDSNDDTFYYISF